MRSGTKRIQTEERQVWELLLFNDILDIGIRISQTPVNAYNRFIHEKFHKTTESSTTRDGATYVF